MVANVSDRKTYSSNPRKDSGSLIAWSAAETEFTGSRCRLEATDGYSERLLNVVIPVARWDCIRDTVIVIGNVNFECWMVMVFNGLVIVDAIDRQVSGWRSPVAKTAE